MKIIFLGPQGSGKSTQAKMLAQKLDLPHIEMGQILRERGEVGDELGDLVKKELELGHLIENNTTISILKAKLKKDEYRNGYVLDGYPRNEEQLSELDSDIEKAFYVKVSDNEAIRRLLKRGRSDDTQEALAKRLDIYHKQTEPLLADFQKKEILCEIDGERTIEEIHEEIMSKVANEKKNN